MFVEGGILLAALGITTLELAEAAAVGLALFAESGRPSAFAFVAAGCAVVFVPTFVAAGVISLLPVVYVRLVGGVLLLYFGQRLAKSARRAVVKSKTTGFKEEKFEKGVMSTGFSVGAVEAFEASIVLVGLLPQSYASATAGFAAGIVLVVVAAAILRSQIRRVKQASMKVAVSALLLTFSLFWFAEVLTPMNDLLLVPIFLVFTLVVYRFANRAVPTAPREQPKP